jgi:hypothetical protein
MEKYKDCHQHKTNPNLAMMASIAIIICAALSLPNYHHP